jgi:hypothetical protein
MIRVYRASRINRTLLMATFKEIVPYDTIPLSIGDRVLYACRNGSIAESVVSNIVYGIATDLSDRDFQLTGIGDDSVYNTTRDRIIRIQQKTGEEPEIE